MVAMSATINDSEKLSTILTYVRRMDEETKKKLEKLRQANGSGAAIADLAYGALLEKMYAVHSKFQKELDEQCRPLREKINTIENRLNAKCNGEIQQLVEKALSPMHKP